MTVQAGDATARVDNLVIRALANEDEVLLLERYLAGEPREKHQLRLAQQQRGDACYLVAWLEHRPAGHLLVLWEGSESTTNSATPCPELEDFYVTPDLRGLRIGVRLLEHAEALVYAQGHRQLGLAVGLTQDYQRARTLYARRGYTSTGFSLHYRGWWTRDVTGTPIWWEEAVEYLSKALDREHCITSS